MLNGEDQFCRCFLQGKACFDPKDSKSTIKMTLF